MDNYKLVKELEEFGFEKDQIELAIKFTQDKEQIIEMIIKMNEDKLFYNQLKLECHSQNNNLNSFNTNLNSNNSFDFENYKMVILVRKDLKMGVGKIAAQVGHAVLKAYKQSMNSNDVISWETTGQAKIVLAVENEETLLSFYEKAKKSGINSCTIKDAGRTQVEAGTTTVCAIGPAKVSIIDSITGNLSLL